MKTIVITEVLEQSDIPELLREIANMVEGGFTSGNYPTWYIEDYEDEQAAPVPA